MPIFERLGYHSTRHALHTSRAHQPGAATTPHGRATGTETPRSVDTDLEPNPREQGDERIDKQEEQVVRDLGDRFTLDTMKVRHFVQQCSAWSRRGR